MRLLKVFSTAVQISLMLLLKKKITGRYNLRGWGSVQNFDIAIITVAVGTLVVKPAM